MIEFIIIILFSCDSTILLQAHALKDEILTFDICRIYLILNHKKCISRKKKP